MKQHVYLAIPYLFIASCGDSQNSTDSGHVDLSSGDVDLSVGNGDPKALAYMVTGRIRPNNSSNTLYNAEAVIPPQCYTRTEGRYNPCYTCHQSYDEPLHPNRMFDGFLQGDYNFSDTALSNHWLNLFADRQSEVDAISDDEVLSYINQENYSGFITGLKTLEDWDGPIPEINNLYQGYAAFDELGFALDDSHWVAFNYKPLPSTFWPTNGSTDDVMIRLPEAFRQSICEDAGGVYSRDAYIANLAIVEAAIKDLDAVTVPEIDENAFCQDLNNDGSYTRITEIHKPDYYVGGAQGIKVAHMLYPEGTEFLHTVRYVGVDDTGQIYNAPRMKEVRHMKKITFMGRSKLSSLYDNEHQEKRDGNLPSFVNTGDTGLDNGLGWLVTGFIEAADGHLRQQTYEENFYCMGCHTTIGTTIDQTFAFPRKVDGAEGWGYINLKGMQDTPKLGESEGEFLQYLKRVGGGDEFRQNSEMRERWFKVDGSVDEDKVHDAEDIYALITPSRARALELNKAYWTLVKAQSFTQGRDATITPSENVYAEVDPEQAPPLPEEHHYQGYDIRLDWQ